MSTSVKLLIVTNGPLCRNPRVVKEATTLGRAGYDVTVLGVRNHPASEVIDAELRSGVPFRHEAIDGFPGVSARNFAPKVTRWLARHAVQTFGWQTPHALGPFGPLLRRARILPADLTIVHNEVPHCIGVRLLDDGRRVAADIEDWHSEDLLPADRVQRPLHLIRATEHALLHRAVYTTTTSEAMAAALQARYGGRRPRVVTNSFPLPPITKRAAPNPVPAFFWFSQTTGPGRGLEQFLAAWVLTQHRSRIVLLGDARPDFRAELLAAVPSARREAIEFLPLVTPADLPALIARYDIGLALEDKAVVNRDLTITNKILQYLGAGLAVVASDTAGQREVLAHDPSAGVLIPLHETTMFAAILDDFLANRAQLANRQVAARRLAESVYCWERVGPRLVDLVAAALAGSD